MQGRVIRSAAVESAMLIRILAGAELAGGALGTDVEGSVGDPGHVDHNGISPASRR